MYFRLCGLNGLTIQVFGWCFCCYFFFFLETIHAFRILMKWIYVNIRKKYGVCTTSSTPFRDWRCFGNILNVTLITYKFHGSHIFVANLCEFVAQVNKGKNMHVWMDTKLCTTSDSESKINTNIYVKCTIRILDSMKIIIIFR